MCVEKASRMRNGEILLTVRLLSSAGRILYACCSAHRYVLLTENRPTLWRLVLLRRRGLRNSRAK